MSTYGSANLRIKRIGNKFGKHIWTDTLFTNLCDYWTEFCNPQKKFLFWHSHIMWKLEMNIRRMVTWIAKVNIIFKKYKEERKEFFDPTRFLEEFDCEKHFELLKDWKIKSEQSYLNEHPYLLFPPRRHKKCFGKPRPCIRGFFFFVILYFLGTI